ncbi:hypothetical protein CXK93_07035 [Stutzerimonas decontaminans]|uniref:Uncharacterized protein n=1 Tax=Stutzerimonas decontaminans TaxID=3022791 RepID=A0ABX4W247_9GAMM|nr:hypothetical protein [Stutzerimonas decontaminans]MCQ4246068.1 hypothetical protein [Stutzerimonas decontaminans]PNF86538.1 hypothetical protein CXK93_07035 [Stutzerimonas decontaminans]
MRLKSLKFTHFRGYRATTFIPIDAAMTGIFDSGDVKADSRKRFSLPAHRAEALAVRPSPSTIT